MEYYDKINEVFKDIFNDSKFEAISNEYYVWKENDKFIIEEEINSKKGWKVLWHKNVVRAICILNKHNLINSPFYKVMVGYDFLRIDVEKTVKIHSLFNHDYRTVLENCNKIQKLLFCKSKIDEIKVDTNAIVKIWIYPNRKINGFYFRLDKRMTKFLSETVDFAKLNSINIVLGEDENSFFRNPEVKHKLMWQDYLFDYHYGICFVIFQMNSIRYSYGDYPFIKKIPEISWNSDSKLEFNIINENDQYYLHYDLFEEWKSSIMAYIKEKNDYFEYLTEKDNDSFIKSDQTFIHAHTEWESDFDNPYYNSDIEADEQNQEFWDSI